VRLAMFAAGVAVWIGWTIRYARSAASTASPAPPMAHGSARAGHPTDVTERSRADGAALSQLDARKHVLILCLVLAPMAAYVYGALRLGWGFDELSAAFVIGGLLAGIVGGLGLAGTVVVYLEGMQSLLPAALMVGVARSISLVLEDGRVVDTILSGLVAPLAHVPSIAAALLMIPFQALIHVAVPSVSGQAVLTMPLFVPLADVLGLSRQVPVVAYQTGAGLMELATPTNGALMAILLAAGIPYQRWLRFALGGLVLLTLVGVAGLLTF
jgi:uncharacterized ion transporter superfamily protein YfcC